MSTTAINNFVDYQEKYATSKIDVSDSKNTHTPVHCRVANNVRIDPHDSSNKEKLKVSGMVVLGGSPEVGKTFYTIATALTTAINGDVVLYYSFEMSRSKIIKRFHAVYNKLETKTLTIEQFIKTDVMKRVVIIDLSEYLVKNMSFEDAENGKPICSPFSYGALCDIINSVKFDDKKNPITGKHNLAIQVLTVIDSLQETPTPERQTRDLKTQIDYHLTCIRVIVNKTNSNIIAVVQSNRESNKKQHSAEGSTTKSEKPTLYSYCGSSKIEYTADLCLFLYTEKKYSPDVDLYILKAREQNVKKPVTKLIKSEGVGCFIFETKEKGYGANDDSEKGDSSTFKHKTGTFKKAYNN